jgi:multidrug efflux system outer membrane protein
MKMKKITVVLLGIAVSSCAIFGPSYKKPDASSPDTFRSKDSLSKIDNNVENLPDLEWWKKFNDPKLNELIIEALKNNNQIAMAIGNVVAAQGFLEQVQMSWVPSLNVAAGYSQNGSLNGGSTSTANNAAFGSNYNNGYSAGLVPGYTLNILQLYRTQQMAKAQLEAAIATKNAMRLTIISQVAGGYLTLVQQNYLLELQKQLVADALDQYTLAKGQYKAGYISLLSLQNYQQQYELAKAQLPIIQNNIVASENAIQVLLNKNPGVVKTGVAFTKLPMDGIVPGIFPCCHYKIINNNMN